MQLQWQFIEDKLREMGFTSETVKAAAAAYAEEREMESRSRLNADLVDGMSMKQSRAGGLADGLTEVEGG